MKKASTSLRRRLSLILVMTLLVTTVISLNMIYGNTTAFGENTDHNYSSPSADTSNNANLGGASGSRADSTSDETGVGPTIEWPTEPQTVPVRRGQKAALNVVSPDATGYYWFIDRNDGNGFVTIEGANGSTYISSEVSTVCDGYRYYCCAYNDNGGTLSVFFTLDVY